MKRTATIVAIWITIVLAGVAYAQSTVWLPVAINDNEQQISAAALLTLNNGDTVRCASGSYLSFSWSADHRTGTARCATPTPGATNSPTATNTPMPATATSAPATNTPVAATNTPTAPTATPSGNVAPYANAPKCPTHDDTRWHSIWNSVRGCYYDHEHGDNPALADDLFGPLGAQWGNSPSAIMPPWGMATEFGPAHGGWKVEVNRDLPGRPTQCWYYDGCVVSIRVLSHFGPKGGLQPEHTFWLDAIVEYPGGQRGIIRTGGTWSTGILHSPYKTEWVNVGANEPPSQGLQSHPGIDADYDANGQSLQNLSTDPYRAHQSCANFARFGEAYQSKSAEATLNANNIGWRNTHFWIMHDNLPTATGGRLYGMTPFVHLAQSIGDGSSCVEAQAGNPHAFSREPFVTELTPQNCPLLPNGAVGCRYNNSNGPILFDVDLIFGSWVDWLDNSQWDTDIRPGWLSIHTFMKPILRNPDGSVIAGRPDPRRFLTEAAGCTMAMMDCVPLIAENVRVGVYNWTTPDGAGFWKAVDHDVNLPNVWWLGTGN